MFGTRTIVVSVGRSPGLAALRQESACLPYRCDCASASLLFSLKRGPGWDCQHRGVARSLSGGSVLGLFLQLVGGLLVLLTDFVELPHVLEEVWRSLEGDEKLGLLAVASVVRGLNCDGLGSDFRESRVVVSIRATQTWLDSNIDYDFLPLAPIATALHSKPAACTHAH